MVVAMTITQNFRLLNDPDIWWQAVFDHLNEHGNIIWIIWKLTSCVFKQNLVVKAKAQLWHSRQEDTHFNGANNLAAENITVGTNLKNRDYNNTTC